jgi:protocatechuate 3,4-dioxygenase beta subunit
VSKEARAGVLVGALIAASLAAYFVLAERPRTEPPPPASEAPPRHAPAPIAFEPAPPAEVAVAAPAAPTPPPPAAKPESAKALAKPAPKKPAPVEVTGRVMDDRTGRPVAGAIVSLEGAGRYWGEGPAPIGRDGALAGTGPVTTRADGAFRFVGLEPGVERRLCIDDPRYAPWRRQIAPARDAPPIEVHLARAWPSGFFDVFCRDERGRPLPKALVRIERVGEHEGGSFEALLDDRGRASVETAAGRYLIRADLEGHAHFHASETLAVGERKPLEIVLAREGELRGAIVGTIPGAPLLVRIARPTEPRIEDRTIEPARDGTFSLALAPGPIEVTVFGARDASPPEALQIYPRPLHTDASFVLSPGRVRVAGIVAVKDGGAPIADAGVDLLLPGGGLIFARTRTDAAGRFAFDGLGVGPGEVRVWVDGSAPAFAARTVALDPGAPPENLVVELARAGNLAVTVVDDAGMPISGVRVAVLDSDRESVSGERGEALFAGLPEGRVELGLWLCGTRPENVCAADIRAGALARVTLRRPR